MQDQIQNPQGFGEILRSVMEKDIVPVLPNLNP